MANQNPRLKKQTVKNLTVGSYLSVNCSNVAEFDSAYQTALQARKELGLSAEEMRVTRLAKEMRVEVERIK